MTEPVPELLVILVTAPPGGGAPDPAPALAALAEIAPVSGFLPPRLALLAAARDRAAQAAAQAAALPGVLAVFGALAPPAVPSPPPALVETLTDAERLFVDAWLARRAVGYPPPPRPGEGESWNSPPRRPPDPPPAR